MYLYDVCMHNRCILELLKNKNFVVLFTGKEMPGYVSKMNTLSIYFLICQKKCFEGLNLERASKLDFLS